jgi:hypothetical protein
MFTGWHLQARPIEEIGVNESRISVLPGGQRMRVRLVIDGRKAGAVFWKLFSGDGIPLVYDWEYRAGDGKPVTSGTWAGPTLSLARRERHEARIENGSIRNSGEAPVVIEYVGLGPTEFFALARAISLAPGDSSPLSEAGLPPDANVDGLWIPPHAVLTMLDPLDVERSFSLLNGDQFIQHITITNLLAAHDEQLGGALEYVEVFATVGEEASRDEGRLGPFRLSAAHTTGSEVRVPVLRVGPREDRVTIWGAAFYENGSCQSLPPTTLDTWDVKLTTSMLAANRPAEPPERGAHSLCSK